MKKYLSIACLFIISLSCKKVLENTNTSPDIPTGYFNAVQVFLKSNVLASDYDALDFQSMVISKQQNYWFLRIGLLDKKQATDFVLLQTDSVGNCSAGKFVQIKKDSTSEKEFIGSITIESLLHESIRKQIIVSNEVQLECEGEVDVESARLNTACTVVPSCSDCLPEVVVVGYLNPASGGGSGISYSDYINLSSLAAGNTNTPGVNTSNGSASAVYSPVVVPGNAGVSKPPVTKSPDLVISYESLSSKPGIDVSAFMKCFSAIPDAGATCSVSIFADLPVNDNPAYIFNILSGATGHCFLQLTKTNGTQSINQIIGFTTSKPLAMLGFPVPGKIVDNTGHKYNASLTMNISPAQLTTEIQAITGLGSNQQYDMWEYNCVNYAVNVLNKVRSANPLQVIQLNDITSGDSYSTPQGLYLTLEQMKKQNGPEANNIVVDVVNNAGTSHGACTP